MKPNAPWLKPISFPLAFAFVAFVSVCTMWGGAACSAEWKDPPAIEMQECIQAERSVGPNPFSNDPNDLALVTTYEEKASQAPDEQALYLVNGIFLDQIRRLQIIYFSALVVNVSHQGPNSGKVSYWLLADTKAAGRIDKALFREKEVTESGQESIIFEVEGTREQIAGLQSYYENAVRMLSAKAESGPPESCATKDEEGEPI